MTYGARIKLVRELNGWTQSEVAQEHSVTQPFIAQIENGWSPVPADFLQAYAFRTGFSLSFFEAPPAESELPLGSLLFRARADITEREQKALRAHASLAHEVLERMLAGKSIREIPVRVPNVPGDPERAAALARSELGLAPDSPVAHVVHTMEEAGILVIGLPAAFAKSDAFCVWARTPIGARRPIVVISANRAADRVRLSAAHELGHLVMHNPLPQRPDVHEEANRFAGAFLLPADALRTELEGAPTTLETFLAIKLKWGVSVQAAVVRAHQLGLITPYKYRTLFQRLSAKGWRTHEPLSNRVPLERPRAFRQIAELLYGKRLAFDKIADHVGFPETFVRALLEAHASREVVGAASGGTKAPGSGGRNVVTFRARR